MDAVRAAAPRRGDNNKQNNKNDKIVERHGVDAR